jgi:hypothetical protein
VLASVEDLGRDEVALAERNPTIPRRFHGTIHVAHIHARHADPPVVERPGERSLVEIEQNAVQAYTRLGSLAGGEQLDMPDVQLEALLAGRLADRRHVVEVAHHRVRCGRGQAGVRVCFHFIDAAFAIPIRIGVPILAVQRIHAISEFHTVWNTIPVAVRKSRIGFEECLLAVAQQIAIEVALAGTRGQRFLSVLGVEARDSVSLLEEVGEAIAVGVGGVSTASAATDASCASLALVDEAIPVRVGSQALASVNHVQVGGQHHGQSILLLERGVVEAQEVDL